MSRTLAGFTFLLIAIVVPRASLRAEEPARQGGVIVGQSTLTLTGSVGNTDAGVLTVTPLAGAISGSTTVSFGTLQVGNGNWSSGTLLGSWGVDTSSSPTPGGISVGGGPSTPPTPIPAGPVFYIITEGAGLGDSVRSVPCTGKETVLDAVGHVNGISQLSSTKIWIARPTPASHDKSTILTVDWEAISKRGINTTNYKLMPGDRLVIGQDPVITRSNVLGKRTAPIERLMGVVSLTTSTLGALNRMSAGDSKVLKELVRKGFFTDDEEMKQLILDAIQYKAGPKPAAEQKAGQGEKRLNVANFTGTFTITNSDSAGSTLTISSGPSSGEAPPHELAMRPLPDYRIEPPDVIQIEMLKLVPLPPYRAAIFDVLQIRAATADKPIYDNFMVESEGTIDLGPPYGSIHVLGKTKDEICAALNKRLQKWNRDPAAYVQLVRVSGAQPVTGQYLVAPDGTVNLRLYGRVRVAGKTVAEARLAIQKQLATFLDSPELSVDVVAYNSKVYYIITQGAGLGDSVRRLPVTGNETVLDAMSQTNGLSQVSSKNIWIARPSAADPEKAKILRVDWDGITGRGATATNYQIFPRDRIYIGEDPLVTRSNLLSKKTAPVERTMGIVSLTSSMLSGLNSMSAADDEVMKELVRKGTFTNDEEMKGILQEAIRLHALEREKARSKEAEKNKPGQ